MDEIKERISKLETSNQFILESLNEFKRTLNEVQHELAYLRGKIETMSKLSLYKILALISLTISLIVKLFL